MTLLIETDGIDRHENMLTTILLLSILVSAFFSVLATGQNVEKFLSTRSPADAKAAAMDFLLALFLVIALGVTTGIMIISPTFNITSLMVH